MTSQKLKKYRELVFEQSYSFFTDTFYDAIWGVMGEDCASVTITASKEIWHLHYIHTQTGEPFPYDEVVCDVLEDYTRDLTDDELYEFLAHQNILKVFEDSMIQLENKCRK